MVRWHPCALFKVPYLRESSERGRRYRGDAAGVLQDHHGRCRRLSRPPRGEAAHRNPCVIRDDLARGIHGSRCGIAPPSMIRVHYGQRIDVTAVGCTLTCGRAAPDRGAHRAACQPELSSPAGGMHSRAGRPWRRRRPPWRPSRGSTQRATRRKELYLPRDGCSGQ